MASTLCCSILMLPPSPIQQSRDLASDSEFDVPIDGHEIQTTFSSAYMLNHRLLSVAVTNVGLKAFRVRITLILIGHQIAAFLCSFLRYERPLLQHYKVPTAKKHKANKSVRPSGYYVVNLNYIDVQDKLVNYAQNMDNFQGRIQVNSQGMTDDYNNKDKHSELWYNLNQSTPEKQEYNQTMQRFQQFYENYLDGSSSSSTEYDDASHSMDVRIASGILRSNTEFWRRTYGKARSVFQRRTNSPARAEWTSNGNCIWKSDAGRHVILTDVHLMRLTEVELMVLQQQAVEEIKLLDIGVNAMAYSGIKRTSKNKARITKLIKKGGRGTMFGRSLEYIVAKEQKQKQGTCLTQYSSTSDVYSCINAIRDVPSATEPIECVHLQVPKLVQICIEHLERYGLDSVGIFRVSTSQRRTAELKKKFDRSDWKSIHPDTNPHMVATLLKKFLRDLPEPLLCEHLYKDFVRSQAICNRHQQMEVFSNLVRILPPAHRDTLYVLLRFLAKVASYSHDIIGPDGTIYAIGNKMDSTNLATVFAPNILRPSLTSDRYDKFDEFDKLLDVIDVVRLMIDHYERLFCVPAYLMQGIYEEMSVKFPKHLNYLCEHRYICDRAFSKTVTRRNPPISSPTRYLPRLVENIFIDDPYQIGPSGSREYREIAEPMFEVDQSVQNKEDQQDKWYDPYEEGDLTQNFYEEMYDKFPKQMNDLWKHRYTCNRTFSKTVTTRNETIPSPTRRFPRLVENIFIDDPYQIGPSGSRQYLEIGKPKYQIDQEEEWYDPYEESDTTNDSENESETENSTCSSDLGHVILHSRTGELDKVLKVIPTIIITDVDTGISVPYPIYERQDLILSEFGCENHKV